MSVSSFDVNDYQAQNLEISIQLSKVGERIFSIRGHDKILIFHSSCSSSVVFKNHFFKSRSASKIQQTRRWHYFHIFHITLYVRKQGMTYVNNI